jgi:O-antigen/teichoic acid export membrane protein
MNFRKAILQDSLVYGITRYAALLVSVFLTPLYTRMLSKKSYAILDIFTTWNSFLVIVFSLGLTNVTARLYFEHKNDLAKRTKTTATILLLILMSFGALLLIGGFGRHWYLNNIVAENSALSQGMVWFYLGVCGLTIVYSFVCAMLQATFQKYRFAMVQLANLFFLSSLGFGLVYFGGCDVLGFAAASVTGLFFSSMLGFWFLRGEIDLSKADLKEAPAIVSFSIHFVFAMAITAAADVLDRWILMKYCGLEQIGIYSIGLRIGIMGRLFTQAFSTSWTNYTLSVVGKSGAKIVHEGIHPIYALAGSWLIGCVLLGRNELLYIFAPSYMEAFHVMGILLISYLVFDSNCVYTIGVAISKKSQYLPLHMGTAQLIRVGLAFALVPVIGIVGAAIAALVGNILWMSFQYWLSQREYPLRFEKKYFVIGLVLLASALLLSQLLDGSRTEPAWDWLSLGVKMLFILCTGVPLGLYLYRYGKGIEATLKDYEH